MNTFFLYDPQFLIQQQLLFQYLVQYNSMIALRNAYSLQEQQRQLIHPQSPFDIRTIEHKTMKNDEIIDEQSSFELQKSKRISKTIKKSKETKQDNLNSSQQHTKKKIFLSMKDIKNAQYKKYKITNDNKNIEVVMNQEQKN
ncbi:unnamed protein product [Paramecium pentaurelia]|uniref:Uncharacterized protein n=1 Tax=Paramecium pentaurelia TaxID=43138 RepID=A0A8S1SPP3_9CILI|nr:unnamed protein product [Paramecium pentaurelia]